ncbi:hypothetical protein [Desulfosarcina ovata]|uniref:hypothetical protein n=1 Tax=Desulfosarcina ovata TaxID=83564 RepID=UPI0012D2B3EC|nr:hypothetical protein [Desulfosarcina ovata]
MFLADHPADRYRCAARYRLDSCASASFVLHGWYQDARDVVNGHRKARRNPQPRALTCLYKKMIVFESEAELFSAIGFFKHGKTVKYQDGFGIQYMANWLPGLGCASKLSISPLTIHLRMNRESRLLITLWTFERIGFMNSILNIKQQTLNANKQAFASATKLIYFYPNNHFYNKIVISS